MRSFLFIPTLAFAALALMASLPLDRAYARSAHDPTVLVVLDSNLIQGIHLADLLIDIPERVVAGTKETEQIGPASPAAAGYASHSPSLLTADNLPLRALEVAPYRSGSVHSRH